MSSSIGLRIENTRNGSAPKERDNDEDDFEARLDAHRVGCGEASGHFRREGPEAGVTLNSILLCVVGGAFGLLVTLALVRMASDQDRKARHEEKRLDPHSEVSITKSSEG